MASLGLLGAIGGIGKGLTTSADTMWKMKAQEERDKRLAEIEDRRTMMKIDADDRRSEREIEAKRDLQDSKPTTVSAGSSLWVGGEEVYVNPNTSSTATTAMKNAAALGLEPGSPEYNSYIRDTTEKSGKTQWFEVVDKDMKPIALRSNYGDMKDHPLATEDLKLQPGYKWINHDDHSEGMTAIRGSAAEQESKQRDQAMTSTDLDIDRKREELPSAGKSSRQINIENMIKSGVPPKVAEGTANGTIRTITNPNGFATLVDTASGTTIGEYGPADPSDPYGQQVWKPSSAYYGNQSGQTGRLDAMGRAALMDRAVEYANNRYESEASAFQSDESQFNMTEQQIKQKWINEYMQNALGTQETGMLNTDPTNPLKLKNLKRQFRCKELELHPLKRTIRSWL